MRKVLEQCPSCDARLEVTRLSCTACETVVLGRYEPCPFCKLSPDSVDFLMAFVKARGNVKEMERELGISYWTIRGQINDLVQELGLDVEPADDVDISAERREILEQLDRGDINANEAAEMLSQLAAYDRSER